MSSQIKVLARVQSMLSVPQELRRMLKSFSKRDRVVVASFLADGLASGKLKRSGRGIKGDPIMIELTGESKRVF